jgi:hypothetical protein
MKSASLAEQKTLLEERKGEKKFFFHFCFGFLKGRLGRSKRPNCVVCHQREF